MGGKRLDLKGDDFFGHRITPGNKSRLNGSILAK
jgi:hypothetical protein